MKKLRYLVVYPELVQMGGAELFTVHLLDALLEMGAEDITLVTYVNPTFSTFCGHIPVEDLNEKIKVQIAPTNKLIRRFGRSFYLFKSAYLQRYSRGISVNYDVCISAWNEFNFGKKAIQYIHAPLFAQRELLMKYKIISQQKWFYKHNLIDGIYRKILEFYGGISLESIHSNLTLANSNFISQLLIESYGLNAKVLYPGFISPLSTTRFSERENNLICLGRIAADKGIIEALPLFKELATCFPNLKIIWFGACEKESGFYKRLMSICVEQNIPLEFRLNRSNDEISEVLLCSKYFFNPKYFEHFGISILEAVNLGCLPIVHEGGGGAEIVPFKELQFNKLEDVIERLRHLQDKPELCERLHKQLNEHKQGFTKTKFNLQVQQAISNFLEYIQRES